MLTYADANVHGNVAGGQDEESESISGSEGELSVHSDRYSFYLLYWYKSTNTDAEGAATARNSETMTTSYVC